MLHGHRVAGLGGEQGVWYCREALIRLTRETRELGTAAPVRTQAIRVHRQVPQPQSQAPRARRRPRPVRTDTFLSVTPALILSIQQIEVTGELPSNLRF